MRHGHRLLTACLLAGLVAGLPAPQLVLAGGGLGESPFEIGQKLYERKNYKTALKYFQKALAQENGRAQVAEVHFWLGEVYLQMKKYDQAEAEYRKAKENY